MVEFRENVMVFPRDKENCQYWLYIGFNGPKAIVELHTFWATFWWAVRTFHIFPATTIICSLSLLLIHLTWPFKFFQLLTHWLADSLSDGLTEGLSVCLTNWLTEWGTVCLFDCVIDWRLVPMVCKELPCQKSTFHTNSFNLYQIIFPAKTKPN